VIAGLPPVLTLPPKEETVVNLPKSVSVDSGVDTPNNNGLPVNECVDKNPEEDPIQVDYLRGKSENGHIFFITDNAESRSKLAEKFPGKAIFTHAEIELLKDCSAEQAEKYIIIKETRGVAAAIFTTAQLAQAEKVSAAP
jgi:hypothetical protein